MLGNLIIRITNEQGMSVSEDNKTGNMGKCSEWFVWILS